MKKNSSSYHEDFFFGLHRNFVAKTTLIFPFRNHLGSHCPTKKIRSGYVPEINIFKVRFDFQSTILCNMCKACHVTQLGHRDFSVTLAAKKYFAASENNR